MSNIYYINTSNQKVDFIEDFPLTDIDDMFSNTFTNVTTDDSITSFKTAITNYTLEGDIDVSKFDAASDVFDYDVYANERGRFYIGEYFLFCNIIAVANDNVNLNRKRLKVKLTITTDFPLWRRELSYTLNQQQIDEKSTGIKLYEYKYPYVYSNNRSSLSINNDVATSSDVIIRMFGPAVNPFVKIGDTIYQIMSSIDNSEYFEINTETKKITKVSSFGTATNAFMYRSKERADFFTKIPPGTVQVTWDGIDTGELIFIEKRSKPKWL